MGLRPVVQMGLDDGTESVWTTDCNCCTGKVEFGAI